MSKHTSKSDKGCVGFVADGIMRKATIYAFKINDRDPSERVAELQQYFGAVKGKYVCVSDIDNVYDKFLEALQEHRIKDTPLFGVSITKGNDTLKSVSETTKAHNIKCGDSDEAEEEAEDEPKTTKKTKSKAKQNDEEDEEEDEDKPSKKTSKAKKASTKKTEKDDSAEEDDDKSSEEESDKEEEKKPKLKKKTKSDEDTGKSKKAKK